MTYITHKLVYVYSLKKMPTWVHNTPSMSQKSSNKIPQTRHDNPYF